ncbi:MAG: hypothetical protein RIG82_00110 [Phycisphaeraceae bacterium]
MNGSSLGADAAVLWLGYEYLLDATIMGTVEPPAHQLRTSGQLLEVLEQMEAMRA